jgi:hypothetical protein
MKQLILDKTQDTPEVVLNKEDGVFNFSGISIPENTKDFYTPIFNWIDEYVKNPNEETIVNFNMVYFNTSSTKSILDILLKFRTVVKNNKMLIINWYFQEEDEDMYDAGVGFSKMTHVNFNYIKTE